MMLAMLPTPKKPFSKKKISVVKEDTNLVRLHTLLNN